MSHLDYKLSLAIGAGKLDYPDPPFYAMIMAAMRKADSRNLVLLAEAFPGTYEEMRRRMRANDGLLDQEYCNECGYVATNDRHVCPPIRHVEGSDGRYIYHEQGESVSADSFMLYGQIEQLTSGQGSTIYIRFRADQNRDGKYFALAEGADKAVEVYMAQEDGEGDEAA